MNNFTLQDASGSTVAVVVFLAALYAPGFLLGYATNLFGFRRMSNAQRSLWAIAYSFGTTPFVVYLLGKFVGLNAVCGLLAALSVLVLILFWRHRNSSTLSPRIKLFAIAAVVAWTGFVICSLVDIQVGGKLYFSVTQFDQSYRVAFTNSVLHTGIPPANPLYFAGPLQAMRYYYFWYVVCATVARIGHVSARQAFIASSVWAGFGLVAIIALYVRYFLGIVEGARRQTMIAVALLAVTGMDLLPAIGSLFAQQGLNGDMEWWSIDQISSWQDSLLWVPHHIASLLCCLLSFLMLWLSREAGNRRHRIMMIVVASVSFTSAFGLSIYLAFGFALLMLAWLIRIASGQRKDHALMRGIVTAGLLSFVILMPYLRELTSDHSRTESGASAQATHVFSLGVRRMIDPGLLTGLPLFASWNQVHPIILDQVMRLLLLLPGLALELGFYGAVLVLFYMRRKRATDKNDARGTALYLSVCGLVMVLFIRSAVISNNDFGYRACLFSQFFLLLLAADVLSGWWIKDRTAIVPKTKWKERILYGLMALGLGGTAYQAVMLRIFAPFEERHPQNGFSRLPTQIFQARTAFAELDRVSDPSAVVEFNPTDPHPVTRDDVVSPYTFYTRSLVMNAGRQILSAEEKCAAEFGGDSQPCAEIEQSTARLYAQPAPSGIWAEFYCRRFGVQYLAVGKMDPVWDDPAGWGSTLPAVASEPEFRIVRCAPTPQ